MRKNTFDFSRMDYEAIRRRKRKMMLVYSIGPSLLVFLVSLWFIVPYVVTQISVLNYNNAKYETARNWIIPATWTSPDRFVAVFDAGTEDTRIGRYEIAEVELREALALATGQRICMAAQNLVISLKNHASSFGPDSGQSQIYTKRAKKVMTEYPDCFKGASSSGGGSASSSSAAKPTTPSDVQQNKLDQKERKGKERQALFAKDEKYDPSKADLKPW